MSRNNSIIKFNENELKIIKENIHSIYNQILNTSGMVTLFRTIFW